MATRSFLAQGIPAFVLLLVVQLPSTSRAEGPWDKPLFSARPAAIVAALAEREPPEDADCEILLQEKIYRIDDQGRREIIERRVVHCVTKAGAEDWAVLGQIWSPWCQEPPQLRARVISRDGTEYELDPSKAVQSALGEGLPGVFTDRRLVQAPLPGVRRGCLIEQESVLRDKKLFFDAGVIGRMNFQPLGPTRKMRFTVDAPQGLPLKFRTRKLDLAPREVVEGGRRITTYETDRIEWPGEYVPLLPPEKAGPPQVAFTTGQSWGEVARVYGGLIEDRLDPEAVRDLAKETIGEETTRLQILEKLLRKTQQLVRYMDVEFGQSSIVPAPPTETIERGYGECKDQATLLVSLLRAAGLQAHVALVNVAIGEDAEDDLPGLNSFDHMIVYVPGETPVWIDPTSEYTRVGCLPLGDQGRRALVIAPETEGLTTTPRSTSKENVYRETCRIELADWGGAKFVQTVEPAGTVEEGWRLDAEESEPGELRKSWEEHATKQLGASSLDVFECTDPHDFSVPFRLHVEMTGATSLGLTSSVDASAAVAPETILERLPFYFRWGAAFVDEEEKEEEKEEASKPERKDPFWIQERYRSEVDYVVVPPPGYRCDAVPDDVEEKIGPIRVSLCYKIEESGTVRATFRLDTGSGELSPKEAGRLRELVDRMTSASETASTENILTFYFTGYRHLAEGRLIEGLAEYKRAAAERPESAAAQARLAAAMNDAGFGLAARRLARRAVEMDDQCPYTHLVLGSILSFDLFGRQFETGYDREAAIAALRKSLELGPGNGECLLRLGNLLERDPQGMPYAPDVDFQEAAKTYRKLISESPGSVIGVENNLMRVCWYSGDKEATRKCAEEAPEGWPRSTVLLAVIAASEGAEQALRKSVVLEENPAQRKQALLNAVDLLTGMRYFQEAAAFLRRAAELPPRQGQLEAPCRLREQLKRHEDVALDDEDPRAVVQRLFVKLLWKRSDEFDLKPFLATATQGKEAGFAELNLIDRELEGLRRGARMSSNAGYWRSDLVSVMEFDSEGSDETAHRVTASGTFLSKSTWYVVKEGDQYRLLDPGEDREKLGEIALARCQAEDPDGARQLMEWAMKDLAITPSFSDMFNPFRHPPFAMLWSRKPNLSALRLGAAALAGRGPQALEILEGARKDATDIAGLQIDRALVDAYLDAGQEEKALEAVDRVLSRQKRSPLAHLLKFLVLMEMGRYDEVRQTAEASHKMFPTAPWALDMRARAAAVEGNLEEAASYWEEVQRLRETVPEVMEGLAWCRLAKSPPGDTVFPIAPVVAGHSARIALFVFAAARAEVGDVAEARDSLQRFRETWDPAIPAGSEWYLVGRLAERCQLPEAAAEAYRKVPRENCFWSILIHRRAQQRLKEL